MPEYTSINLDYTPVGEFKVFVPARSTFTTVNKSSNPRSSRQEQFRTELLQIGAILQSRRLPVYIRWNNVSNRMDRGCIGHALASGFVRELIRAEDGTITGVEISETEDA